MLLNLEQQDDSDDSDSDEDSDDEEENGKKQDAAADRKPEGDNKRSRPEDMQGPFVAVKRANVSLLATAAEQAANAANSPAAPTRIQGKFLLIVVLVGRFVFNIRFMLSFACRPPSLNNFTMSADPEVKIGDLSPETYALIAAAARNAWPKDPLDQPIRQCRMRDVIEVIKKAYSSVGGKMSKNMVKEMFQTATKGSAGKPPFLVNSGKLDGKTVFNLI